MGESIFSQIDEEITGADTVDYQPDPDGEPEDATVWIPYAIGAILFLAAVGFIALFFIFYF